MPLLEAFEQCPMLGVAIESAAPGDTFVLECGAAECSSLKDINGIDLIFGRQQNLGETYTCPVATFLLFMAFIWMMLWGYITTIN